MEKIHPQAYSPRLNEGQFSQIMTGEAQAAIQDKGSVAAAFTEPRLISSFPSKPAFTATESGVCVTDPHPDYVGGRSRITRVNGTGPVSILSATGAELVL